MDAHTLAYWAEQPVEEAARHVGNLAAVGCGLRKSAFGGADLQRAFHAAIGNPYVQGGLLGAGVGAAGGLGVGLLGKRKRDPWATALTGAGLGGALGLAGTGVVRNWGEVAHKTDAGDVQREAGRLAQERASTDPLLQYGSDLGWRGLRALQGAVAETPAIPDGQQADFAAAEANGFWPTVGKEVGWNPAVAAGTVAAPAALKVRNILNDRYNALLAAGRNKEWANKLIDVPANTPLTPGLNAHLDRLSPATPPPGGFTGAKLPLSRVAEEAALLGRYRSGGLVNTLRGADRSGVFKAMQAAHPQGTYRGRLGSYALAAALPWLLDRAYQNTGSTQP